MEILENELDKLIDRLSDPDNFRSEVESVKSIYPFSKYEYIISSLLARKCLSFEEYIDLRNEYIDRNLFLYVFEMTGPRSFGDTWGFGHLLSVEPELRRPNRKMDNNYKGQYDLFLPYMGNIIKIEVKASRAVNRDKSDEPLYMKALSSKSKARFLMNFQQIKPGCCDVFIWMAVFRDCVKYWVLKNTDIYRLNFEPQHRNASTESRMKDYKKEDIYEGQVMITNDNVKAIEMYKVEGRAIRQAIIERFNA